MEPKCIQPKGSSGFCALLAPWRWVASQLTQAHKALSPPSCKDQGSCCSSKTQGVAAPRASGRRLARDVNRSWCLLPLLCTSGFPFLLQPVQPLLRLGECLWVIACGAMGWDNAPTSPVSMFSGLSAALAAAASWSRRGGMEQEPLPRALCGSPDGGCSLRVLLICYFAAQIILEALVGCLSAVTH